jgi:hypothetical protein
VENEVGMLCMTTLYHNWIGRADWKVIRLSQICLFSRRYLAEKAGVVVRTRFSFLLRETEAMTGLCTPLLKKALLKVSLVARESI